MGRWAGRSQGEGGRGGGTATMTHAMLRWPGTRSRRLTPAELAGLRRPCRRSPPLLMRRLRGRDGTPSWHCHIEARLISTGCSTRLYCPIASFIASASHARVVTCKHAATRPDTLNKARIRRARVAGTLSKTVDSGA